MDEQLTTRQVAEALSVSESSVKRWCDCGAIPTVRTVGGHRRIPMQGFLQFLEQTNRQVHSPLQRESVSVLLEEHLPSEDLKPLQAQFLRSIESGDEADCRSLLSTVYSQHKSIAYVADQLIATAFQQIGERWGCGSVQVYQERRACEIVAGLLHEFRRLIPPAPPMAPLALGGAPAGDHYTMPTQMVELVLRECNWQAMNLGCNLPLSTIAEAAHEHRPKLLWLSVSHLDDPLTFVKDYADFRSKLPPRVMVVIGGRALTDTLRPKLTYTGHCDNMRQLAAFAAALHGQRFSVESCSN